MSILRAALLAAGLAFVVPSAAAAAPLKVGGATFYSTVNGATAGASVAKAGDVNGDGAADVVIGAPHASTPAPAPARKENGVAYVVFGPFGAHQVIDLDNLGARGFKLIGGAELEPDKKHPRSAGAGLGGVNGDGRGDVSIAAQRRGEAHKKAL